MNRLYKLSVSIASLSFSIGVIGTTLSGRLYPALPVGMFFSIVGLAIPIFVGENRAHGIPVVISVIPFSVGYRLYVFMFTEDMVGLDPAGVALTVQQVVLHGNLSAVSQIYFYRTAPLFHTLTAMYSVVGKLPANEGFLVWSVFLGIFVPLVAVTLVSNMSLSNQRVEVGVAVLLASVVAMSIKWGYAVSVQSMSIGVTYTGVLLSLKYISKPYRRYFALLSILTVIMTFTHKLPAFLLIVYLVSYLVLNESYHMVSFKSINISHDFRKRRIVGVILIALSLLYIQWMVFSGFLLSVFNKLYVLFLTAGTIPTGTFTPAAAISVIRTPEELLILYMYGFVLMLGAGAGWVILFLTGIGDIRIRYLLALGAVSAIFVLLAGFSGKTTNPQRALSFVEVPLVVLATAGIVFVYMSDIPLNKAIGMGILCLVVFSQLAAPIAAPDGETYRPRTYLTLAETEAKAYSSEYADGPIRTDTLYAGRITASEIQRGHLTKGEFRSFSTALANGNLTEQQYEYVLWRQGLKVLRTAGGVWRLTYDPGAELDRTYHRVYDNDAATLYRSRNTTS